MQKHETRKYLETVETFDERSYRSDWFRWINKRFPCIRCESLEFHLNAANMLWPFSVYAAFQPMCAVHNLAKINALMNRKLASMHQLWRCNRWVFDRLEAISFPTYHQFSLIDRSKRQSRSALFQENIRKSTNHLIWNGSYVGLMGNAKEKY